MIKITKEKYIIIIIIIRLTVIIQLIIYNLFEHNEQVNHLNIDDI